MSATLFSVCYNLGNFSANKPNEKNEVQQKEIRKLKNPGEEIGRGGGKELEGKEEWKEGRYNGEVGKKKRNNEKDVELE
jgi:hypothetical protein